MLIVDMYGESLRNESSVVCMVNTTKDTSDSPGLNQNLYAA